MKTSPRQPEYTAFSKDVLGRYVCNGLDEAIASTAGGGRPFDVVIVGGGSFGAALAQHLLYSDKAKAHRILVLEAGVFLIPEHVQNLPTLGLWAPGAVEGDPGVRSEVWGIPWRTGITGGFPGLAYCVGGRSVFWGGWAPRLLDEEMPLDRWPQQVVDDLRGRFFDESARQIGVDETNDFIFGTMHRALRTALYKGLHTVTDAIQTQNLPSHLPEAITDPESKDRPLSAQEIDERKLEAPLAVQGRDDRSGFFPMNKFSGAPLLMRAARQARAESGSDDKQKRLMVVPDAHVTYLETAVDADGVSRVAAVHVGPDDTRIPIPDRGVVVLASGTIESTRLALQSFQGTPWYDLIGTNLMAHIRSNYVVAIPRTEIAVPPTGDLETSALFVKGRKAHSDGTLSHFHLQITAAGLKGIGNNSEGELFQKIPDIDTVDNFRAADEDHVIITFRAVGEMQPRNPENRITLSSETDEFGQPRAFVTLGNSRSDQPNPGESQQTANDRETWRTMDAASDQVLAIFADPAKCQNMGRTNDVMGSTHHESGTLFMGVDPSQSVTTPNARFHHVPNAYAIGPALLPTMGSPNPMLSGVALARRLAEHLTGVSPPPSLETGFAWLFDGTPAMFGKWQEAGPGGFRLVEADGLMVAQPGSDIGLLFFAEQPFSDFVLRLQFRVESRADNSGVFVRFADPRQPPPGLDPKAQENPAFVGVFTGFELQIDDMGAPDGADKQRTGAVYKIDTGAGPGLQQYRRGSPLQPGEWNDYEIEVSGQTYSARLNGFETTRFTNTDPTRGLPASHDPNSGFIGVQSHNSPVSFRAIRIKA